MEEEEELIEQQRYEVGIDPPQNDFEVIEVFQVQLQKQDRETMLDKILSEEDCIYQQFNESINANEENKQQSIINFNFKYVDRDCNTNNTNNNDASFPALVSIDTHRSGGQQRVRTPLDLVCIVDNSGSMSSENKMKLVRKSLRYLMKVLNDKDRLSIITFSLHAKIRCGFLRNSIENKEKLKNIVKRIQPSSSTNILSGLEDCMWLLKNRKYKNPITSVFLLSDGKDDKQGVVERARQLFSNYNDVSFDINAFGYGSDHDPMELSGISALRNGNFFYITELKRVSEYFLLALGALLNVVADNLTVKFLLQDLAISKVFGADNLWKRVSIQDNQIAGQSEYEIVQPHLIEGDLKQYACELSQNLQQQYINSYSINQNVATLSAQIINSSQQLPYQQQIYSTLLQKAITLQDIKEVLVSHLRAKGAGMIAQARECAILDKFEEAQSILSEFMQELNRSEYKGDEVFDNLKQDLNKAQELCQRREQFESEGKAFMIKKERNLLKRTGSISCGLGWTQAQTEIMQEYKEGKLALSDDSCPSRYGDEREREDFFEKKSNINNNEQVQQMEQETDLNDVPTSAACMETEFDNMQMQQEDKQQVEQEIQNSEQIQSYQIDDQNQFENQNAQTEQEQAEEIEDQAQEDDEEEEEDIELSSLAQKLLKKEAHGDKINMKNF